MLPSFSEHSFVLRGPYLEKMSDDEFFDFCQQHPDLRIERTLHRAIRVMSPSGGLSSKRNARLNGQLYVWWTQHQELGEIFESNGGFRLPDGSMRAPDTAWVSASEWNALNKEEQTKFAPVCPDFVIELPSDSDTTPELQEKMTMWLRNGAQLAWLLVPETETAYLYRPGQPEPAVVQGFDHELSGEAVLPGFQLRLAELR